MLTGCSTPKKIQDHYTFEDKQVFDLIERLNKDPKDKEAKNLLPEVYDAALYKRYALKDSVVSNFDGGDKHMLLATNWEVIQNMHDAIIASPAANKIISEFGSRASMQVA